MYGIRNQSHHALRFDYFKQFPGVVGAAYEGAGGYFREAGVQGEAAPAVEFFGRNEVDYGQVLRGGLQVLADGEHAAAGVVDVGDHLPHRRLRFAQAQHNAGFGRDRLPAR